MPTFEIKMRCVVTKQVTVEGCTEEEATERPWDFAIDEVEVEQVDWEIVSIEETEVI